MPLVNTGLLADFGVNIVQFGFIDFTNVAFSWVNEAAFSMVFDVWFVDFQPRQQLSQPWGQYDLIVASFRSDDGRLLRRQEEIKQKGSSKTLGVEKL